VGEVLAAQDVTLARSAAGGGRQMAGGHVVDVDVVGAAVGVDEGQPARRLEDDRAADSVDVAGPRTISD
jgi:hypothetical protein